MSTWLYGTLRLSHPNAKRYEYKRGSAKKHTPTTEAALQALAKATGHPGPRMVLEYRYVVSVSACSNAPCCCATVVM